MADADAPVTVGSLQPKGKDAKSSLDQLDQAVARAKECIEAIEGASKKAAETDLKLSEILAKASESQAKADNEALRANHAKQLVEEHSNAAAALKGSMDVDVAVIAKKRAEIETIVQSFANLRSTSESDATAIASMRKTADEAAKSVTEASSKATAVQATISETKKNIEDLAQTVREETKSIKADVAQTVTAKETSATLLTAIQKSATSSNELQERSKTVYASIESIEKNAKAKAETVSDLVEKSLDLQSKVAEYEKKLSDLQNGFAAVKNQVEGLLPGATSAGLASAFATQRKHFEAEREKWAMILVGSLGLLMLVVIAVGWSSFQVGAKDWGEVLRHVAQRLPYMVSPIWLAIYAGRQHMMATQMEGEYANKETISTSFEGFKRELASNPEAAKALYDSVLEILARRPGLVYEGHHQDVTPLTPTVDAFQKIIPTLVDSIAAKLKGILPGKVD